MSQQLFESTSGGKPAAKRPKTREPSQSQPHAEKRELAPVVNGVCSEHGIAAGSFSGLCRMCVGFGLLQGGWRPAHLLSQDEIDDWLATNEQLPRTRRGYGQERS